jgi:RNA polymerase sigma factor (sigma-70 family)
MDDAALVEAARRGDGAAWGAIYDRYADKLHDHCHRILRDRDEAADALHDAFIAASRHLDQLRDPSRLRPWLYSICRHESLRRVRQRSRVELTDELDDMKAVDVDLGRGARAEELQELVWAAAAGLNPRDQALLDLNVRQGLEGQDLADAMGTSLNNSYVRLSRLRDQVERSLGALLIARLGRDDCEELDGLLQGWDGKFSPILRKRVARHVDGCDVCRERRSVVASPMALLAAAPIVPAPSLLRDRVLDGIGSGAPVQPVSFTRDGFAAPEPGSKGHRAAWVAMAAVLLVLALVAALLAVDDPDEVPVAAIGGTTTTTEDPTTTTEPTTTTIAASTSTTAPEVVAPTTQPQAPPATTAPSVAPPPPADTTPPTIASVTSQHPEIRTTTCSFGPQQSTITAAITGATSVQLSWSGPPLAGTKAMTHGGTTWTATLGPFDQAPSDLMLHFTVTARDTAGNQATRDGSIMVTAC